MKKLLIAVLCLSFLGLHAQEVLFGKDAQSYLTDAQELRLKNQQLNYIKFSENSDWNLANWMDKMHQELNVDARISYQETSQSTDDAGQLHIRFKQLFEQSEIAFSSIVIHVDGNKLIAINGEIVVHVSISNTILKDSNSSLDHALDFVGARTYKWQITEEESLLKQEQGDPDATYFPTGKLCLIGQIGQPFRYAYRYDIYSQDPLSRQYVFVDAQDGQILDVEERIHTGNLPGIAHTAYSGIRSIITDSTSGQYRLRDTTRGMGVFTFDLNNSTQHNQGVDFWDNDNVWNNVNPQLDQYAADAHWGAERMFDYLDSMHNRNSIDGQGFALLSYVHYGSNYNNAFWDGQRMTYGDGNATTNPLTSIDIAGHEIAHGLTNFTSALRYRSESGALNESFSDIFGVALEFYSRSNANWLMGEDIGGAFRSISNPNAYGDPDTYDGQNWIDQNCIPTRNNDWCGVHTNSGVQNHWFYLLTNGGTGVNDRGDTFNIAGLGMDKAAKIAFRNLTVYLSQNSDHDDARFYAIKSAIDLYGGCSPEVESTTNAWYAVGVGSEYTVGVDANFVATDDTLFCSVPTLVNFASNSNNVSSLHWDFGDGVTSTQRDPAHTYFAAGQYTVKLVVDGGVCGQDSLTRFNYITVDTNSICSYPALRNGLSIINECAGTLYDHGGLNGDYYTNSWDTVIIQSNVGDYIQLSFDSVDVESGYNGFCNHDYIEVFDGPNTSSPSLGRFCSANIPSAINSTSNSVTIVFHSDEQVIRSGFIISWICQVSSSVPFAAFNSSVDTTCTGLVDFKDQSFGGVQNWSWNFGDGNSSTLQNPSHEYLQNGVYTVSLSVDNSQGMSMMTATKNVVVDRPLSPLTSDDSACVNGNLKLAANGNGILQWFANASGGNVLFVGDTLTINNVDSDTNFYVQDYFQNSRVIGTPLFITGNSYHSDTTAELYFTVHEPTLIESSIINSNRQGNRIIDVRDASGQIVLSKELYVPSSPAQVTLNIELAPGDYSMSIGNRNPGLLINRTGASYPYHFGNFLSVTGSSIDTNAYPFFYYIAARQMPCISPRTRVDGYIDTNCVITSINNLSLSNDIQLYPNPTNREVIIKSKGNSQIGRVELMDINAKLIQSLNVGDSMLKMNLDYLDSGIYFIRISNGENIETRKLVKY